MYQCSLWGRYNKPKIPREEHSVNSVLKQRQKNIF